MSRGPAPRVGPAGGRGAIRPLADVRWPYGKRMLCAWQAYGRCARTLPRRATAGRFGSVGQKPAGRARGGFCKVAAAVCKLGGPRTRSKTCKPPPGHQPRASRPPPAPWPTRRARRARRPAQREEGCAAGSTGRGAGAPLSPCGRTERPRAGGRLGSDARGVRRRAGPVSSCLAEAPRSCGRRPRRRPPRRGRR